MSDFLAKWVWNAPVIVILIFGVIMAAAGWKRGFIKMVLSTLAVVIAFAGAWLTGPPVSSFIVENTTVDEKIEEKITDKIGEAADLETALDSLPLPEVLKERLTESLDQAADSHARSLARETAGFAVSASVCVLLFIVFLILLKVIIKVTDLITKLPVIHQLNGLLGLALGLLEAWLIINIVFLLLTTLVQAKWGTEILNQISANPLTAWLYEHNFLLTTMK